VTPQIVELDRISIVAPLGLRFWDGLTNQVISDGLYVTVYPPGDPQRSVHVYPNRGGVFGVRHVRGLRVFEGGAGDAEFWASANVGQPLLVEVVDADGRFTSFSFRTWAPQRGLAAWTELSSLSPWGSPPGSSSQSTAWVPLFSATTRAVAGGVGVIRGQLFDPTLRGGHGGPAAWAVLEVDVPGQSPVRSIADAEGRVAVLFAYPTPPVESLAGGTGSPQSPLSGPTASRLTEQTWVLTLRIAYTSLQFGPGRLPDLDDTFNQPPAVMWADLAQTRPLTETPLYFGLETVLRSVDDSGSTRPSVVFVHAGSPH
jgi:hypothetical protein